MDGCWGASHRLAPGVRRDIELLREILRHHVAPHSSSFGQRRASRGARPIETLSRGVRKVPKRRISPPPPPEPRQFQSTEEIDRGIAKLSRRAEELEKADIKALLADDSGADDVLESNVRETIREVFGSNSPEFREHEYLSLWAGPMYVNMGYLDRLSGKEAGRKRAIDIVRGLIDRLKEKREDLTTSGPSAPTTYFDRLNLHPRILDVARDLFLDGYHWEAVFAAAKALVNYVKERSGRHDLEGAPLMRAVFSKNGPALTFNDLKDQTDLDEQEGMMHLFEGAVLGIRNPGGHTFPEGTEQRAVEYIGFLSLLAYRVQEAKRVARP